MRLRDAKGDLEFAEFELCKMSERLRTDVFEFLSWYVTEHKFELQKEMVAWQDRKVMRRR